MFEFLFAEPYEQRVVGRDNFRWGFVSTAEVNDGAHPYETAVAHKKYNEGNLVVVEAYDDREEALAGHSKWVKTMTAKKLPHKLVVCHNSNIAQALAELGDYSEYKIQD